MTWPAKKCNCVTTKQEQEVSSVRQPVENLDCLDSGSGEAGSF